MARPLPLLAALVFATGCHSAHEFAGADAGEPDAGCAPAACLDEGVCRGAVPRCVEGASTCDYGRDHQSVETACDGLDNDCDGETDEGCDCRHGEERSCGEAMGECLPGVERCRDGAWSACVGAVVPTAEVCNRRDDDCDGAIDETCTCREGTSQRCGLEVGACEGGVQRCLDGAWGACEGAIHPETETCDGTDEDCDGVVDEELVGPVCPLSAGVCGDARATCRGALGFGACGHDEYGADYVEDEASGGRCDGLDDDCDGFVDESCPGGAPLLTGPEDLQAPSVSGSRVAYLSNEHGNADVFVFDLATGLKTRLTATPEDEGPPTLGGDVVVYTRGAGSASRALRFDLSTGVETPLSTVESDGPTVSSGIVVWSQERDGRRDLMVDLGGAVPLHNPHGLPGNQVSPALVQGARFAVYLSDATGAALPHYAEWGEHFHYYEVSYSMPIWDATPPIHNLAGDCWTDGARVGGGAPAETADWEVHCARWDGLYVRGTEVWASGPGAQIVESRGSIHVGYRSFERGNWDVGIGQRGGPGVLITDHPAEQRHLVSEGELLIWQDRRSGTWDLYFTRRPRP